LANIVFAYELAGLQGTPVTVNAVDLGGSQSAWPGTTS
jgi:hypothetical protein